MWYYFSFINKVTVGLARELNACLFSFLSKAGTVAADLTGSTARAMNL